MKNQIYPCLWFNGQAEAAATFYCSIFKNSSITVCTPIDYYWDKLTEGGEESNCGWLKDKFGMSWQIVPTILGTLMTDPAKSQRVMEAFMQMKKFDIEKLKNA
jgi:predicted 3-demethylubiquinone-9 3-methyltransferase (glyoxalase superfamily)